MEHGSESPITASLLNVRSCTRHNVADGALVTHNQRTDTTASGSSKELVAVNAYFKKQKKNVDFAMAYARSAPWPAFHYYILT